MERAKGFTLIELLVVISIISILTATASASFMGVRQRSRDGVRKSDIRQIQSALEQYRADQGYYPSVLPACGSSLTKPTDATTVYMKSIPCDSNTPGLSYSYIKNPDVSGNPGNCDNTSVNGYCRTYILKACLENSNDTGENITTVSSSVCSSTKQYQIANP